MINKISSRFEKALQVLLTGKLEDENLDDIPQIRLEEVAEAKTFFPLEKFFVFGHARSGTTLLTRLLRLHPEVHCNYQAHFFTRPPLLEGLVSDVEVRKWFVRSSNRWNRKRDLSPVVLRAVSDYILERDARREGKTIVGDKSPNSLLNGEAVIKLSKIYPDTRLIFLVRDGRDAVVSHRFQTFIDNPHRLPSEDKRILESFMRDPDPYMTGNRSLFTRSGLEEAAQGWVANVEETDRVGRELFGDRYISLRFEDLLAEPWDTMSNLWAFLGASSDSPHLSKKIEDEMSKNPDADWQREKATSIADSLVKGKQGSWKDIFTGDDQIIFSQIAGDTLISWGYEIDMQRAPAGGKI